MIEFFKNKIPSHVEDPENEIVDFMWIQCCENYIKLENKLHATIKPKHHLKVKAELEEEEKKASGNTLG